MDICVKREKFESDFESEQEHLSTPWEVYGSWVKAGDADNGACSSGSTELIIPLCKRPNHLEQDSYLDDLNRARREFVPDEKKDRTYWNKRVKNNASARRSRLKKKIIEKNMESKLKELQRENIELKYELAALRRHFADQIETQQPYDEVSSDTRADVGMRTGSGSDSSDSGSVTSEGDGYNGSYDNDRLVNPHFPVSSPASNQSYLTNTFPYNNWTVPFKYSFMQCQGSEKGNNSNQVDGEVEVLAKIPHKFRHKKDFHSAFYVQQFTEENA